jgi:LmbE family N-acetylglucosaminyl deacetylase
MENTLRFQTAKHRAIISSVVIILLAAGQSVFHFTTPRALADSRPAEDRGAAGLGQAIKRLGTIASVLHTGAHPDDEDSGLLAYLARGRQARTAYLSLTRGDGGQNLIGPELYEALGVIRTEELLAARRLDGAQQFFTRAFDFGFSKSPKETLAKWDRDAVLGDMVRVIRTFRPLIIVSAWTGTKIDGHGHHQAAGLLIPEAYRAAGDPSRYPEQLAEGLKPWQAKKFYIRVPQREELERGQEPPPVTVTLDKGQYDALLGRSYSEIAMQGRSQHRSQDQGAIERRGPQYSKLRLMESTVGKPEKEQDIFDNLPTCNKPPTKR